MKDEVMSIDLARAWKDPNYRETLRDAGIDIDESPAGFAEIPETDLASVSGGTGLGCALTGTTLCDYTGAGSTMARAPIQKCSGILWWRKCKTVGYTCTTLV